MVMTAGTDVTVSGNIQSAGPAITMKRAAAANALRGVSSIEMFTKVAQERIRHRQKGEETCKSEVV